MQSKHKRPVLPTDAIGEVMLVYPFSEVEYTKGITAARNGKAAGIDDVRAEQQNNLSPSAHKWLLDILNKCFAENTPISLLYSRISSMKD